MRHLSLLQFFTIFVLFLIGAVERSQAIEFNGYFRSGLGSNGSGGDQVCFETPGARAKYRLGNECETYSELSFSHRVTQPQTRSYFLMSTMLAYKVDAATDWEQFEPSWRQVFVEYGLPFGGLLQGAKLWTGKRFYRRHDIHINDFFYWDNSGPGAGIENVRVGNTRLAYALRRNVTSDERAISSHDLRLYSIDTNRNGQLTLGLNVLRSDESQTGFDAKTGAQLNIMHVQKDLVGLGANTIIFQYGMGVGATLDNSSDDTISNSEKAFRLIEAMSFTLGNVISGMVSLIYEDSKDGNKWYSFGIRPIYHFSDNANLAVEFGTDVVEPNVGERRNSAKLTIAPQLSMGRGFFSRPVLRAFVTFAVWNEATRLAADPSHAMGSNGIFGDRTDALSFGFQAETWW